ncbi:MAG: hypothetical protein M3153_03595 [Chloroflexota bacterium]|nr:hypothetical protein [Chloroflexota bacterium]
MRFRGPGVAILIGLAGCSMPSGVDRPVCHAQWLDIPAVAAEGVGVREIPLPIECIEEIGPRRLRVGFTFPAGPDCHLLQRVIVRESADAVSIGLIGAVNDDPNAGSCPEEPRRAVTEVDLAARIGERILLDGGGGAGGG